MPEENESGRGNKKGGNVHSVTSARLMAEMEQAKKSVEEVCSVGVEGRPRLRHRDQRPAGRRRDIWIVSGRARAVTLCPSLVFSAGQAPPNRLGLLI